MLLCPTCGKNYPSGVKFCSADQSLLQADATVVGDQFIDPLIGQTLNDKYRIEQRLGVGGMGTVYRARHVLIDRAVAVKVLNQRFVEDEAARTRFQREAKAAGRLQHINAVGVTDFGQTPEGYVYIVMELLEGRTLRDTLAREAPVETARAVALMLQAAAAVEAAHEAGIIHRDLKPANIFVTQRADVPALVKVLDFGIAKLAADSLDEDEPKALTQVGAMIGTPRYMSPEQCSGQELTAASDVYSLGVILYEMLTGTVPFSGSTPLAIALKHLGDPPRSPRELVSTIPEGLERVVLHALEKRPEDRPADAGAFRRELLQVAESLGLEHSAVTLVSDLDALRGAGVESPSGRLVIDLARLRESGAFTSGASELTIVGNRSTAERNSATPPDPPSPPATISRVSVNFPGSARRVLIGVVIVAALLLSGLVYFASRSRIADGSNGSTLNADPLPAVSPTPSPSPLPSPTPRREPSPKPSPSPSPSPSPKKSSKVGSFVNKVKRILAKPF